MVSLSTYQRCLTYREGLTRARRRRWSRRAIFTLGCVGLLIAGIVLSRITGGYIDDIGGGALLAASFALAVMLVMWLLELPAVLQQRRENNARGADREAGGNEEPTASSDSGDRIAFEGVQIGRSLQPLSQNGFVVISRQELSLLDGAKATIANGPISSARARLVFPPLGSLGGVLFVTLGGTKYSMTPGISMLLPGAGIGNSDPGGVRGEVRYLRELINGDGRVPGAAGQ